MNSKQLTKLTEQYHQALPTNAREWLHSRGINDTTIELYKIGYGDPYDEGIEWVIIPIRGTDGSIIGFKLRRFPDNDEINPTKYKNFPAGISTTLFNSFDAASKGYDELMIVEGEFDAMVANLYNLPFATALTAGANTFKDEWLESVKNASVLWVCLDNDEAGETGSESLIMKLNEHFPDKTIMHVKLPDDVNDLTDYFIKGYKDSDLLENATHVAGPPMVNDADLEEMSIDELADVLDNTIRCDRDNKCILFLAMLTTYTESDQLNVCLLGPSSSGKTYLAQRVADFFPECDIKEYAGISPTALKHSEPVIDPKTGKKYVNLERVILLFSEMPDPQMLTTIRPLLSHDRKELLFATTDRNKNGGNSTKNTVIRGFPSVIFCSANARLDEQEATRALLLSPEVSDKKLEESVRLTNERTANRQAYDKRVEADEQRKKLMRRIQYIKRLNINSVIIPGDKSAKVIARFRKTYPKLVPSSNRAIEHLNSLIKAVAMLNAKHRMDENKNVIVKDVDIEAAFELWDGISRTQSLGVPPSAYNFYMDFIVPAYEEKVLHNNSINEFCDDGITMEELLSYHYSVAGSVPNAHTVQKVLLPTLIAAGLISKAKGSVDKRNAIFKPTYGVREEVIAHVENA